MTACYTCELLRQRDSGSAPPWDNIQRSTNWDLVHSYNTSLRGWLVLILRRHVEALDELSEAEAIELGQLIRRVSQALKAVTGCAKTYVVQFAEAAEHPHVHVHIIPRMADQPDAYRGPGIFQALGVPEDQRVSEAEMDQIALEIRRYLQ